MKKMIILGIMFLILVNVAFAKLELDNINFDPAIIAAGDEVDVVIQFHADVLSSGEDKVGNPDYQFKVILLSDDSLTSKYVIIQDSEGDDTHGTLFSGDYYNKKYSIKVNNNAPAGNYEFKLEGRWYKNGIAEDTSQFVRFKVPVKKEGIILDVNTLETVPAEVRPGDNYVKIVSTIENVGEKDAKSVEVTLNLPQGLGSSYSNNNRVWVGRLNKGESKEVIFFVDIDENISQKLFDVGYNFEYLDLDDNSYTKKRMIPFLVKPRPYLEVVSSLGSGKTGDTVKLSVVIKNTGSESAESVDIRVIKQNSQPFELDVRSDYIGELEPVEEGVAIFDVKINSDAEIKEHDLKLIIRSKGDSDEGDDNIYTYNRRAKLNVTGKSVNWLLIFGIVGFLVALGVFYKRRYMK